MMIYYWTYDANLKSRQVQNNENIKYYSLCKKYVVFTKDNIHIHCINPIQYYRSYEGDLDDHLIPVHINDAELNHHIRVEETVARKISEAMYVPPSAKYICFSDTHGDIGSLCLGYYLYLKSSAMTIECGDVRHYRYNFWKSMKATATEDKIRSDYSAALSNAFNHQHNYFSLQGNHDEDRYLVRITVSNKERQLIFNHAIPTVEDEVKLFVYKRFIFKGDSISFWRYDEKVTFHHSGGVKTEAEDAVDVDSRFRNMFNNVDYNPYIVCGHDNNYMYVSKNIKDTFPIKYIKNRNVTIKDVITSDTSIFSRIISTDGMLRKLRI